MSRITTTILVVLILTNGSASIMIASGLSEDLGVTLAPGMDSTIDETTQALEEFRTSEGLGDTLFALFSSAGNSLKFVVSGAFALPTMLTNLGFPGWIVVPLFAPAYILGTLEIVSVFTGRDMV